ncbi:MAG: triose-phosphate isomerase [Gammaproteobacteria bacterium]
MNGLAQQLGTIDAVVAKKADAAWCAGLLTIVCIGETVAQRKDGEALSICANQITAGGPHGMVLAANAIAYEPLWAIGTGDMPTDQQSTVMHAHIHQCRQRRLGAEGTAVHILYGGSVKPSNAQEILALPAVGGALVGGASPKARDFERIVNAVST